MEFGSFLDFSDTYNWYRIEAAKSSTNPRLQIIAALSVVYFVSKLLLFYPLPSAKKCALSKSLKGSIIAHRGSREEGLPENTLAAFKDAIAAGADIVELDVWMTKDGKIVVHHDESLNRMTQGACKNKIHEMDYSALPSIVPSPGQSERIESVIAATGGSKSDWQRIPQLEEVLRVLPDNIGVIVEFKQDSNELIDAVHNLVSNKLGDGGARKRNMFWFSLTESINAKLRVKDASIPTIVSTICVLSTLALFYLGLLPFFSFQDAVYGVTLEEIPLHRVRNEKSVHKFPDWFKRLLAFLLSGKPPSIMIAPSLFTHLKRRGIPVWFLGCENEDDLKIAIKAGATAVLTDRVNWLTRFTKQRGIQFHSISE